MGLTETKVLVALPGALAPTEAGTLSLGPSAGGAAGGRFRYDRGYLARLDAVELDPVVLPLGDGEFRTERLGGLFGAFRDACPDYWGRLALSRMLSGAEPDEGHCLRWPPDDGAGAVSFDVRDAGEFHTVDGLGPVRAAIDAVLRGDPPAEGRVHRLAEYARSGTALGGARPKVTVEDGGALWVAKFNKADDRWNMATVEHATLRLAEACGLDVAASRVVSDGGADVLLVRRFDRERADVGWTRARMASGLTLLGADEGERDLWSYPALADALSRVSSNPGRDLPELFRRMCFNALVSNVDDHPRNHAAVASGSGWRLSPAYDVTPATPLSVEARDLAMSCGDMGRRASATNLVSQAGRFLLGRDEAAGIADGMRDAVASRWHCIFRANGVSEADCGKVATAFAYEGFGRAA